MQSLVESFFKKKKLDEIIMTMENIQRYGALDKLYSQKESYLKVADQRDGKLTELTA